MPFATRYTYEFIKRFLPAKCRRILEVGCGTGELAALLSKDGYSVVAIDTKPESVAAARQLGVDARIATWPNFDEGQFDAVLFAHSLHHIYPLEGALRHVADSLAQGGSVIVEDFAHESADEKTLRWFASTVRLLEATGALIASDEFLEMALSKTEMVKPWRQDHGHDLHRSVEIDAQLEKVFGRLRRENAPFYFRYIADAVATSANPDALLQAFAEQEKTLAADGSIAALGRRYVARHDG
ncbi:MAG TPA: class I SAM-dependent methyltransferase [Chthoniobacterales bacterium]|jgi:SAM-dependent methyltransferase|nr:class I SAM-dependent methyltransferase [Chthoniobacterales bacterium]